ncbi:MAG: S-layer homology domain-containing protein [Oscillospiraceae bacterium]|nr:S-layer homology domain-containing protein [Oscillospiraceae bacterium]
MSKKHDKGSISLKRLRKTMSLLLVTMLLFNVLSMGISASPPPDEINLISATANGTSGTVDTDEIELVFSEEIAGLTTAHITISNESGAATVSTVTNPTATASSLTWVVGVTSVSEGLVEISVADFGGYDFDVRSAKVWVNEEAVVRYTAIVLSPGGSATGGGSYVAGDTVNINAGTAPAGYSFTKWTADDPSVSFTPSDTSSTATFTMPAFDVTVTAIYSAATPTVGTVTVNPSSITLLPGSTFQFSASVTGTNYPSQEVTWSLTGGGSGTTISSNGLLTIGATEATSSSLTVTATSTVPPSIIGTSTVTITLGTLTPASVTSLTITPGTNSITLEKGADYSFSAVVLGANDPSQAVVWSVSGGSAGTSIDAAGKLTVASNEQANTLTIKAVSVEDPSFSDTVDVAILQLAPAFVPVSGITGIPTSTAIGTLTLAGTVQPSNATNTAISWTVADPGATGATITAGVVTTSATGTMVLRATIAEGLLSGTPGTPYVKDFTINVTSGSGGSSSGGGGGGSSSTATVTGGDGSVSVAFTLSDGVVTLSLPDNKIKEIVDKAEDNVAILDMSKVTGATDVALPTAALAGFADAGLDVEFILPEGAITLDNEAVESLIEQAGDNVDISLKILKISDLNPEQRSAVRGSDVIFDITISSAGKSISEFDGKLKVTVPYNGPLPAAVWYLNDAGELEKLDCVYDRITKTISFVTDHLSLYVVGRGPNPFTDVADNAWYFDAAMYVFGNGFMIGTADDKFSPNSELSRGMIVTILYRYAGEPSVDGLSNNFNDVRDDQWYTDAIIWAANNGIVLGYGDGRFGTNDPVTKEQLAALILRTQRAEKLTVENVGGKDFTDTASISPWATDDVSDIIAQGLFNDIPGTELRPRDPASRAEIASLLCNWLSD